VPARDSTPSAPAKQSTEVGTNLLLVEVERLKARTDSLERELGDERERRTAIETAFDRQHAESRHLREEAARLRTELQRGEHPPAHIPAPAWTNRKVNPSLRTKWRWITRLLVVAVAVAVLGTVYLLVRAYIDHQSIQHVWSNVRNAFYGG